MNQRTLAAALIALAAAFAVTFTHQRSEIASLRQQLAALEQAPAIEPVPTDAVSPPTDAQPPSPPEIAATATEAPSAEATPKEPERMMRSVSRMMENPAFSEIVEAQQKGLLDVLYNDLVNEFQLSPEQKSYFMDLLLSRQMFRAELSMKLMSGELSPAEREALAEEMRKNDESVGKEIEYFLNDEQDTESWKFYEKTMSERMETRSFKAALTQAKLPLDQGIDRQLIEAMQDERSKLKYTTTLMDQSNLDLSADRFSDANIQALESDLIALQQRIAERVAELLTPEQLAVFARNQKQMRDMQISQVKMAAQMFSK